MAAAASAVCGRIPVLKWRPGDHVDAIRRTIKHTVVVVVETVVGCGSGLIFFFLGFD